MGILTAVNQFNSQKDGVSSEERRSIIRRKMEYHQTLCSLLSLCFICPYSITDHCWCTKILFQTAHHSLCLFCSYSIFLWIRFPECHHVCLYNSLYLLRMLVLAQIKLSHLGRKPSSQNYLTWQRIWMTDGFWWLLMLLVLRGSKGCYHFLQHLLLAEHLDCVHLLRCHL